MESKKGNKEIKEKGKVVGFYDSSGCEYITPKEAADICTSKGLSVGTQSVRYWCTKGILSKQKIAKKFLGRWYLNRERFLLFLDKEFMEQ